MRTTPITIEFDDDAPGAQEWTKHTINLKEHLKTPARDNTAAGAADDNKTEPATTEDGGEDLPPKTKPAGAGSFDDGTRTDDELIKSEFEKQVKQWEDENDPVTLSKMLIQLGNVGRIFFVPGLYFKLMYQGQEAFDLKNVIDKSVENEKKNIEPTTGFNNYEKRLYNKLPVLRETQANCSYTQPEMDEAAGFLARWIRGMTVAVFLSKYMWIIFIGYLEAKHAQPIIEQKGADFFNAKLPGAK